MVQKRGHGRFVKKAVGRPLCFSSERVHRMGGVIVVSLAFMCIFEEYRLLNYCIFPLADTYSSWTREISSIVSGLILILIAVLAPYKPALFSERFFLHATLTFLIAGAILLACGIDVYRGVVVSLGVSFVSIGIQIVAIVVCLSCMNLKPRDWGICIACAYALSYALRAMVSILPLQAAFILFAALSLVAFFLVFVFVGPAVRRMSTARPQTRKDVVGRELPHPLTFQLLASLVVFRFVYGYALTFGEIEGVPLAVLSVLIPLVALALYACLGSTLLDVDALINAAVLLGIVGFLLIPLTEIETMKIAQGFLSWSAGFFEIASCIVLLALASRSKVSALTVIAGGVSVASWGSILGANMGRMATQYYDSEASIITFISALSVLFLAVYLVFVRRSFNFSQALCPPRKQPAVVNHDKLLASRCAVVAQIKQLTLREHEILHFIARGRNGHFIEKSLMISYATVKTHTSHIYAKLGVHSQQEVIDLIESTSLGMGGISGCVLSGFDDLGKDESAAAPPSQSTFLK